MRVDSFRSATAEQNSQRARELNEHCEGDRVAVDMIKLPPGSRHRRADSFRLATAEQNSRERSELNGRKATGRVVVEPF